MRRSNFCLIRYMILDEKAVFVSGLGLLVSFKFFTLTGFLGMKSNGGRSWTLHLYVPGSNLSLPGCCFFAIVPDITHIFRLEHTNIVIVRLTCLCKTPRESHGIGVLHFLRHSLAH